MTYGLIAAGRLPLREDFPAGLTGAGMTLKGQESSPPLSLLELERRREDLLGLDGDTIPVTFTSKARLSGFYRVQSAKADLVNWTGHAVATLDWTLELVRLGTEFELDHESRLSGPLTRNTSHAVTGERWLAPPVGHYGFWSGTTSPTAVTRTGIDGPMLVYRNVPATHPRWGTTTGGALAGRVRFLDDGPTERTGTNFTPAATGWELANGLVRVRPLTAGGVLEVAAWDPGAGSWETKAWDLTAAGVSLGAPRSVTLLRNQFEATVVRVLWGTSAGPGRTTVDLTLRRGSRFVELYVQASTSTTLAIVRATAEGATAGTGYLRATADDAAGNRYVLGSAQAFSTDLANGGISKAATRTLDAFLGVALAGGAAVVGDQPDHLMAQYLGSPGELVVPVRR
jgi:hypothetical protein